MYDFTPYQTRLNLFVQITVHCREISSFIKTRLRNTANVADEGIRMGSEILQIVGFENTVDSR